MAYHAERGRTVLFGGGVVGGGEALADTWEWDGVSWTQRAASGPSARVMSAMAYDGVRRVAVLYGGYDFVQAIGDTWDLEYSSLQIDQPPATSTVYLGDQTNLTVLASGPGAIGYQWRRNTVNLVDGGRIAGVTTPTLTINYVQYSDAGQYDVVVTNTCGTLTSDPATLAVVCYPNCDGSSTAPVLNANDFSCFLNAFAAGDSYANCDGSTTPPVLNANDFTCFLNKFAAGCP
jgi:hypothetical protein